MVMYQRDPSQAHDTMKIGAIHADALYIKIPGLRQFPGVDIQIGGIG